MRSLQMADALFYPDLSIAARPTFAQSVLILPTVSVGNVGQLAIDLLIATCNFTRVGFLDFPEVLPVTGNDAYKTGQPGLLHTPVEVFQDPKRAFTVVQQRSPIVKGEKDSFIKRLLQWIIASQFSQVFVLTGADSRRLIDTQLDGPGVRYASTSQLTAEQHDLFVQVHWKPLERFAYIDGNSTVDLHIFGAGIARKLIQSAEEAGLQLITLIQFTDEGDNIRSAIELISALDAHFGIVAHTTSASGNDQVIWQQPPSWNHLYGMNYNQSMYF